MNDASHSELVDRLIDLYCDWRTACLDVRAAYERFSTSLSADRAVAYAAYTAALDREECACDSYAAQIRVIEPRCSEPRVLSRPPKMHHV